MEQRVLDIYCGDDWLSRGVSFNRQCHVATALAVTVGMLLASLYPNLIYCLLIEPCPLNMRHTEAGLAQELADVVFHFRCEGKRLFV